MCLREKIGPDPRNFNQRVSLGRNDLLIRTFLSGDKQKVFVETTWQLFGEISYVQQIELFKRSYLEKKNYAKPFYVKTATKNQLHLMGSARPEN
jgi:hypothetical protein